MLKLIPEMNQFTALLLSTEKELLLNQFWFYLAFQLKRTLLKSVQ